MESFLVLPEILMEYIFSYLGISDLVSCSLVCTEWYRIINSNRIWRRLCENSDFFKRKFYIKEGSSIIENPLIRYSEDNFYSLPSEWKSHFNRCSYLKNNWRSGRYAKFYIPYKIIFATRSYVVEFEKSQLIVRKLSKAMEIIGSFQIKQEVTGICGNDSFIAFRYGRNLSLLKMCDGKFEQVLLDEHIGRMRLISLIHLQARCTDMDLSMDSLVYFDGYMPSILKIFDLRKDAGVSHSFVLEDKLNTLGRLVVVQVKTVGDVVLLLYEVASRSWLVKFELEGVWDDPVPLEGDAVCLYASARYACVKTNFNELDNQLVTGWELRNSQLKCVAQFSAHHHSDIVFLSEERVMFYNQDVFVVKNLFDGNRSEHTFINLPCFRFSPVWDCYVVLYNGEEVSVWNWKTGKRLHTLWKRSHDVYFNSYDDFELFVCDSVVIVNTSPHEEFLHHKNRLILFSFW